MKYIQLKNADIDKITDQAIGSQSCYKRWEECFLFFICGQRIFPLKAQYKPNKEIRGMQSVYQDLLTPDDARKAEDTLRNEGMLYQSYNQDIASLKLHINLNQFADLDDELIQKLIQFLIAQSQNPANNLQFDFKIVLPAILGYAANKRFAEHAQLTIYFDKYSSVGGIFSLAQQIESFLTINGVPQNDRPRDQKDVFGINNFVSARFDNNKLLKQYGQYPFFDRELGKFFLTCTMLKIDLSQVPVSLFEVAFNNILCHSGIAIRYQQLDRESSEKVQQMLLEAVREPRAFLLQSTLNDYFDTFEGPLKSIYDMKMDLKDTFDEQSVTALHRVYSEQLEDFHSQALALVAKEDDTVVGRLMSYYNRHITGEINQTRERQESLINSLSNLTRARLNTLITDRKNILKPLARFQSNFDALTQRIKELPQSEWAPTQELNEGNQFGLDLFEEVKNNRTSTANWLTHVLGGALDRYKAGEFTPETTAQFQTTCDQAIAKATPLLETHRGLKKILVNLAYAILGFGIIYGVACLVNLARTDGKHFFFNPATELSKITGSIKDVVPEFEHSIR